MVVKFKESFEKTRHIKHNDKSKKYILKGQRNAIYHEKILSNKKKFEFSLRRNTKRAVNFSVH